MQLADLTVRAFADTVASDAPAPGGGSAAAFEGAVGAALTAMVACLTQGRKKYAEFSEFAAQVEQKAGALKDELLAVMDRDTEAFNTVSRAFSLPKETEEQKAARSAAIQEGLKGCTQTPMEMMVLCDEAITLTWSFLEKGFNQSAASDLGAAFLSLKGAMQGAWLNVLINIGSIKDTAFANAARQQGEALLAHGLPLAEEGYARVLCMIDVQGRS